MNKQILINRLKSCGWKDNHYSSNKLIILNGHHSCRIIIKNNTLFFIIGYKEVLGSAVRIEKEISKINDICPMGMYCESKVEINMWDYLVSGRRNKQCSL